MKTGGGGTISDEGGSLYRDDSKVMYQPDLMSVLVQVATQLSIHFDSDI